MCIKKKDKIITNGIKIIIDQDARKLRRKNKTINEMIKIPAIMFSLTPIIERLTKASWS
ncbi:hypothetical protein BMS3Abin03_00600 [bacterium BMS3Abin03]|nr:hypothetical protein BMS3Abin03_00600 [bacterium BMS3Abin03]